MALAVGAVDPEHVLQEELHDPIRLAHLDFVVTLGARQIERLDIALADVLLDLGELNEAIVAGARPALGALEDVRYHQHANGTLEVLGLDAETRVTVEVRFLDSVLVFVSDGFHHLFSLSFLIS